MKFISPNTTERPTASRNNSMANCRPFRSWRRNPARPMVFDATRPAEWSGRRSRCDMSELAAVGRVLHRRDAIDDVEVDFVPILLRFVDVEILNDVVGLGVDAELAARALDADAVECLDQRRL